MTQLNGIAACVLHAASESKTHDEADQTDQFEIVGKWRNVLKRKCQEAPPPSTRPRLDNENDWTPSCERVRLRDAET